jgi:hypothetical protein
MVEMQSLCEVACPERSARKQVAMRSATRRTEQRWRASMARDKVVVKKLDVRLGDVVEITRRRYDVVSDKQGGVALEPAIPGTVADLHARHGERPATQAEFDELFGDLPCDGEG